MKNADEDCDILADYKCPGVLVSVDVAILRTYSSASRQAILFQ